MARTRKHDAEQAQRLFVVPSEAELTKPKPNGGHVPPQNRRDQQIMANVEKRARASETLRNLTEAFMVEPVRSNQELIERVRDYFLFCSNRQLTPTVEALALYLGFTRKTLNDWKTGHNGGFKDYVNGMTTKTIIERATEMLAAYDGALACENVVSAVPYIWRSKNYYDMSDSLTIKTEVDNGLRPALTPEEIAKNLPEPVESYDIMRNLADNTDFDDMEGA